MEVNTFISPINHPGIRIAAVCVDQMGVSQRIWDKLQSTGWIRPGFELSQECADLTTQLGKVKKTKKRTDNPNAQATNTHKKLRKENHDTETETPL